MKSNLFVVTQKNGSLYLIEHSDLCNKTERLYIWWNRNFIYLKEKSCLYLGAKSFWCGLERVNWLYLTAKSFSLCQLPGTQQTEISWFNCFLLYTAQKRWLHRKFAHFVLFRIIKKRSLISCVFWILTVNSSLCGEKKDGSI